VGDAGPGPRAPAVPPGQRVTAGRAAVLPAPGTAPGRVGHRAPVSRLVSGWGCGLGCPGA